MELSKPIYVKLGMTVHNNEPDLSDLAEAASILRANKFWGIEPDIRDPRKIDKDQLASIVSENGLQITALATGRGYGLDGLNLSSPDNEVREKAVDRICGHVDLACELKTNVIIGLMRGIRDDDDPVEACNRRLVESLIPCGDYAEEKGCEIFFEAINHNETNIANSAADAAELIKATGSPAIKLLLDTFHLDIEESSSAAAIEKHLPLLGHFHLADRNRGVPGTVRIDFGGIVRSLLENGYDGAMTVEIPLIPDIKTCAKYVIRCLNKMRIYSVCQK